MAAFLPVAFLWGAVAYRSDTLRAFDDDWTLLMLPVGVIVGAWVASRTMQVHWVHLACLPVGAVFGIVGLYEAIANFASAGNLSGTGPMAGLGEYLAGALFTVMAATGILVMGITACGTVLRRTESAASGEIDSLHTTENDR